MQESLYERTQKLLMTDNITQDVVYSFSCEERIDIINNNIGNYFYKLCNLRNIKLLKRDEIYNCLLNQKIELPLFILKRYIYEDIDIESGLLLLDLIKKSSVEFNTFCTCAGEIYNKLPCEKIYLKISSYLVKEMLNISHQETIKSILSLDNDQFIIDFINKPSFKMEEYQYFLLINNFKDYKLKEKYITILPKDIRSNIIYKLPNDKEKEKYLRLTTIKDGIVISSLDDDKLKEKYLRRFWILFEEEVKGMIISSFESEDIKKKYLKLLSKKTKIEYYYFEQQNNNINIEKFASNKRFMKKHLYDFNLTKITTESILYIINNVISPRETLDKLESDNYFYHVEPKIGIHVISNIINKFNSKEKKELLMNCASLEVVLFSLKYIENLQDVIDIIEDGIYQDNLNNNYEYNEKYNYVLDKISKFYNIKVDRLITFTKKIGFQILKYIKKENVQDLFRMNEESWESFELLISSSNYTLGVNNFNDILNSLLQKRFIYINPPVINSFVNAMSYINNNKKEELNNLLKDIELEINIKETLESNKINYNEFVDLLLRYNNKAIDTLHTITSNYIMSKREKYVQQNINRELSLILGETYNVNQAIKYIMNNNSIEDIEQKILIIINETKRNEKIESIITNKQLKNVLLAIKEGDFSKTTKEEYNVVRNFLKQNINSLIEQLNFNKYYVKQQFTYDNEQSQCYLLEVIQNFDAKKMEAGILHDNEKLNILLKILNKYKLLGWGDLFNNACYGANYDITSYEISLLIENFDKIFESLYEHNKLTLKKNNPGLTEEKLKQIYIDKISLTTLFDALYMFCPSFEKYSILFKEDNYKYILTDPMPYKSKYTRKEKLNICKDYYIKSFNRTNISVIPVDKEYKISNDKSIHINIGNFTNPINLTYGERTSSCMRVGGFAESLYSIALENDNGFHIRLTDQDNNLISRVTGFRNGNTVVLNQLRYPLIDKYSIDQLYTCIKNISEDLIIKTRNDEYPIENVIISPSMALNNYPYIEIPDINVTKGYDNLYCDINNKAIVLATIYKDIKNIKYNLNPNNINKYEVLRDSVYYMEEDKLMKNVERLKLLNEVLHNKQLELIEINKPENLLFGYIGEDFFIAVDSNYEIVSFLLDKRVNDSHAKEEFNKYYKLIEEKVLTLKNQSLIETTVSNTIKK